jgi:hypothetical protein
VWRGRIRRSSGGRWDPRGGCDLLSPYFPGPWRRACAVSSLALMVKSTTASTRGLLSTAGEIHGGRRARSPLPRWWEPWWWARPHPLPWRWDPRWPSLPRRQDPWRSSLSVPEGLQLPVANDAAVVWCYGVELVLSEAVGWRQPRRRAGGSSGGLLEGSSAGRWWGWLIFFIFWKSLSRALSTTWHSFA